MMAALKDVLYPIALAVARGATAMTPLKHMLYRIALAIMLGALVKAVAAAIWGIDFPLGVAVNIGLGIWFFLFWIWPFPWAEVLLLSKLETKQLRLLPHKGTRLLAGDCTGDKCVFASSDRAKCIRLRYMAEQTNKRIERLKETVIRSGAPYFAFVIIVLVIGGATAGTPPGTFGLWQAIQVLSGFLSISWSMGIIYAEVSYQRSLNYDLTL